MNKQMSSALAQGDQTPVVLNGARQEMIFEGMQVEIIEINGEPYFEIYSTGMALGQVKFNSVGKAYPRKDRIDENIQSAGISVCVRNGHSYISEEQLYDLMLEMKTDKVKPFRKWVTSKVLPSIRKTGSYSTIQPKPMSAKEELRLHYQYLEEQSKEIESVRGEVTEVREEVTDLKDNMPLFNVECKELQALVRSKGVQVLGGYKSTAYNDHSLRGKVYSDIQRQIKREFGVSKYEAIKRSQLDIARSIVEEYKAPTVLVTEISNLNNQMRLE